MVDHDRKEVFAPANDHIFETAYDVEVALLVHGGQISAMGPIIAVDYLGCLLGHLVITGHLGTMRLRTEERRFRLGGFRQRSVWQPPAS